MKQAGAITSMATCGGLLMAAIISISMVLWMLVMDTAVARCLVTSPLKPFWLESGVLGDDGPAVIIC